jgi:CRP-like cAMP-binding protein
MAASPQTVELLGRSPLFAPLTEPERRAVAEEMREVSYAPGQVIFGRGDAGRDIYLVTGGRVRLSILTAEGRELSFAHAEPGTIFGEIAMLDGGPRTADATAVNKVTALTLSKGAFTRLIESRPHLAEAAIRFLCARVREADQQLEAIALYPIEGRLARFFLATAKQRSAGKAPGGGKVTIDLEMSQSELALLVGASRPKVNAALASLEDSGAIERQDNRVTCDLDELAAIAGVE